MKKPKWYTVEYLLQWAEAKEKMPAKIEAILAYSEQDAIDQVTKIMRIDPLKDWPQVSDLVAKPRKSARHNSLPPGKGVG